MNKPKPSILKIVAYAIQGMALLLLLQLLPLSGHAQPKKAGNWLMYFGANKVSDQLSIHSEIQYRDHVLGVRNIEQLLLRVGLNYHFSDKLFVTGGYGRITGHVFESEQAQPETKEDRIWQQLIFINQFQKVKLEHRFRIEQRWQNNLYSNRYRYRIMAFLPLNKPKIERGALFLGIYDEIFLNGKNTFYDRNRLYGALGYQVNQTTGFQIGLLHQHVEDFGKLYLQFAMVFNPDFRKPSKL